MTPAEKARAEIVAMLTASGWVVQSKDNLNLSAALGVERGGGIGVGGVRQLAAGVPFAAINLAKSIFWKSRLSNLK